MISQELWPPPLISETDDTQQNAPLLFFSLASVRQPLLDLRPTPFDGLVGAKASTVI
jgi:hypothetical protein